MTRNSLIARLAQNPTERTLTTLSETAHLDVTRLDNPLVNAGILRYLLVRLGEGTGDSLYGGRAQRRVGTTGLRSSRPGARTAPICGLGSPLPFRLGRPH